MFAQLTAAIKGTWSFAELIQQPSALDRRTGSPAGHRDAAWPTLAACSAGNGVPSPHRLLAVGPIVVLLVVAGRHVVSGLTNGSLKG